MNMCKKAGRALAGFLAVSLTLFGAALPAAAETAQDQTEAGKTEQAAPAQGEYLKPEGATPAAVWPYLSDGDYLYRTREDGSAEITGYTGDGGKIKLPFSLDEREITLIAADTFSGAGITGLELPDGLKEIGANPFAACPALEKFVISPYHEYFAVIDGVLFEKSTRRLVAYPAAREGERYEVPRGIREISARAFAGSRLREIILPDTVEVIGDLAFERCENLESFALPDSVTRLGANPFAGCAGLKSLLFGPVREGAQDLRLVNGLLVEAQTGKAIAYLESLDQEAAGNMLSGEGEQGKTFTVPAGISSIGDYAFAGSADLSRIELSPEITAIGEGAFARCTQLKEAVLPPSLTVIGERAFEGCEGVVVTVSSQLIKRYCDRYNLDYIYADEGSLDWLTAPAPQENPAGGNTASWNGHIVCIDAGHQQHGISEQEPNGPGSAVMKAKLTTGTQGIATGLTEFQLNLDVSLKLRDELAARGYQVVMIRETNDCPLSNAERAEVANNSGAEVFLRIHANSSDNSEVRGAMFYAPSPANIYMSQELVASSNAFASTMLNVFCATTGIQNRGLLQDDTMTGINWCRIPVTIAEMGFMSNPDEDRLMADPEFQKVMAKGLADGIDAYFGMNK